MENRPFSGNVGVSTYSGRNRLLLLAEAIVVTAHGMLSYNVSTLMSVHFEVIMNIFMITSKLSVICNTVYRLMS